ncbi:MAG: hypothetical protein ACI3XY_09805 [Butyricicoccaceae bacterium]
MSIGISVFGSRVALAAILPYLVYTVLPVKNEPAAYRGGNFLLQQLERVGMMACALMTALGTQLDHGSTARVIMMVSVVLYDIVMIRYFAGGRDISREAGLLLPRTALQLVIFWVSTLALSDSVMTKFLMLLAVGSIGNAAVKRSRMAVCLKKLREAKRRPAHKTTAAVRRTPAVAMSCDASKRSKHRTGARTTRTVKKR